MLFAGNNGTSNGNVNGDGNTGDSNGVGNGNDNNGDGNGNANGLSNTGNSNGGNVGNSKFMDFVWIYEMWLFDWSTDVFWKY